MTHLLNIAAMPKPGNYTLKEVSASEFFAMIKAEGPNLKSHIGYEANLELIKQETGVKIPLLRAKDRAPELAHGDYLLIMKLKRVDRIPALVDASHFIYYHCQFKNPNMTIQTTRNGSEHFILNGEDQGDSIFADTYRMNALEFSLEEFNSKDRQERVNLVVRFLERIFLDEGNGSKLRKEAEKLYNQFDESSAIYVSEEKIQAATEWVFNYLNSDSQ